MKLYEISDQYLKLLDVDGIDQETLQDTLESITDEFNNKGIAVAGYFQNLDADIKALKEAEQRIASRRKAIENKSNSLKEYLLSNMQRLEITEISCPEFVIKLRKPKKVVNIIDDGLLDSEYFTTIPESWKPNKVAIKTALDSGVEVDGAELIDGKQSLIIK